MGRVLYVAFKGKNNSSYQLVRKMNTETFYLTNSFAGICRDIDRLPISYDRIIMFGLDKNLHETIRFEKAAQKDEIQLYTSMDVTTYLNMAKQYDVACTVSETPTTYLCNEAYFYMLKKMDCPVLFIHIPSMPHMSDIFFEKLKNMFINEISCKRDFSML